MMPPNPNGAGGMGLLGGLMQKFPQWQQQQRPQPGQFGQGGLASMLMKGFGAFGQQPRPTSPMQAPPVMGRPPMTAQPNLMMQGKTGPMSQPGVAPTKGLGY